MLDKLVGNLRLKIILLFLTTFLVSCLGKGPTESKTGCEVRQTVTGGDRLVALNQDFIFDTPTAKNDCHARYKFLFRWASDERAANDTNRPPLRDLSRVFGPSDEFSYFPHPKEFRFTFLGKYLWVVDFSIGNKNSNFTNTRYGLGVNLDPDTFKPGDSVAVSAEIEYTPYE
jgi:hypothetical protein